MSKDKLTKFKLQSISWVNYNTQLYRFQVPNKGFLNSPIGSHITVVHGDLKRYLNLVQG